jgi:hypothetical protein
MAEGFDPIEAGRQLHEHGEQLHQRAGKDHEQEAGDAGQHEPVSRHSRIVQVCEAVLLALVTLTAAWAGYSAARWSTESRVDLARSSTLRDLATRADIEAVSIRNFDAATFNAWFIAYTLNSPQKELVAERRFRPEFRVAFNAWMATNPLHNPNAPPGPTYMPQYKVPGQALSASLDSQATTKFNVGNQAGLTSDDYVQITVFLAAVLFLVGIGSSFKYYGVRYSLIVFGAALLVTSIVLIVRQPGLPS